MDYGEAHAEADKALNDSSYKMGGLSPLLSEITNPTKTRLILYDGFLLAEGKAFNLKNISVIKVDEICESIKYGKYLSGLMNIQIGFDIVFEFEKNNTYIYKSFRLGEAIMQEIKTYLNGVSTAYPIDIESIISHPLKQIKAITSYEMEMLFNTIQR